MVLIMESHTEEFIMKEKVVQSFFQPPMTNNATVATRQLIMGQVLDRTAFVEASCLSGGGGGVDRAIQRGPEERGQLTNINTVMYVIISARRAFLEQHKNMSLTPVSVLHAAVLDMTFSVSSRTPAESSIISPCCHVTVALVRYGSW